MEAAQRAEKFRLGGKSRFSDDGLNFEGTPPNNGFQLVIQAHIFHFMVPLVRIGEQKRRFCEAVN